MPDEWALSQTRLVFRVFRIIGRCDNGVERFCRSAVTSLHQQTNSIQMSERAAGFFPRRTAVRLNVA